MGMKPRIEPLVNKKICEVLVTEPHPDRGAETYTRLEPFTVTARTLKENSEVDPKLVTGPRKHA